MHWNPLDYDSTFEDASRLVADCPEKDNFEARCFEIIFVPRVLKRDRTCKTGPLTLWRIKPTNPKTSLFTLR